MTKLEKLKSGLPVYQRPTLSYLEIHHLISVIDKKIADKYAEFKPLETAIAETKTKIAAIEHKLSDAPELLANGEISTDEILNTQSELTTLKNSLASFETARGMQKRSIEPLYIEKSELQLQAEDLRKQKIMDLPAIYAGKIDKEALDELLMTFAANSKYYANFHARRSPADTVLNFKVEFFDFFANHFEFPETVPCLDFCNKTAEELLQMESN